MATQIFAFTIFVVFVFGILASSSSNISWNGEDKMNVLEFMV